MPNILKCTRCGHELRLSIGYTGADWDTIAGEGGGYTWQLSLNCTDCGTVHPLGGLKSDRDFSAARPEIRSALWPYGDKRETPLQRHIHPTAKTDDHAELLDYLGQSFDLNYVNLDREGPSGIRVTDRTGECLLFEMRDGEIWQVDEKEGTEKPAPLIRKPWAL